MNGYYYHAEQAIQEALKTEEGRHAWNVFNSTGRFWNLLGPFNRAFTAATHFKNRPAME